MSPFQEYALKLQQIQFHPTNRCNLNCVFCWPHNHTILNKEIDESRLKGLVIEACSLSPMFITISGGGEPLLREELAWMMETIKSHNIAGALITNGTLIKKSLAEKVVEIGWDEVQFSIHSPNAELDRKIRGGNESFSKTVKGIKLITACKKKADSERPTLAIRFVITHLNFNQISAMVPFAHSLGINKMFLRMVNAGESTSSRELSVKQHHFSQLLSQITFAQQLADKCGLKIKFEFDISVLSNNLKLHPIDFHGNSETPYCKIPFTDMMIFGNGLVGTCCNYIPYQFVSPPPRGILEDATLYPLEKIWKNGFLALREKMISNNPPQICRNCSHDMIAHKHGH